ncbi:hypothetical protein [Pandoraea sp.]|uniref:hypothetical protein n=1 Tax=Pandoraea sp. TaxID=1883445 RepID=UPI001227E5AC|nr:hypothetical protein [Pandoraea sp.]TAL56914.1 MAG: hypothetical protein EPN80_01825 [Pandoraea sp.]TAM17708.1 MAG: hypothetical protein EPN65_09825 [Pandoraea sp.]
MRALLPLLLICSLTGVTRAAWADPAIHIAPYRPPAPPAPASAPPLIASPAPAPSEGDRAVKAVVAAAPSMPAAVASRRPLSAPDAKPALVAFSVRAGQDLTTALGAWLKGAGWTLDWQAQGASPGRLRHFVADADWATRPASVPDLLRRTLAGLGVRAQVLDADKRVVVRNDNFSEE